MFRNGKARLIGACIALAAFGVGVGFWLSGWGRGATSTSRTNTSVATSATEATFASIWNEEAKKADIPDDSIHSVAALIVQASPGCVQVISPALGELLRTSLRRYLLQFKARFDDKNLTRGTCYWTAWLLVEAANRPRLTPKESEEIRNEFSEFAQNCVALVKKRVHEKLQETEVKEFSPQIEQGTSWVLNELQSYFEQLHGDILYPGLKAPLMPGQRECVMRFLSSTRVPTTDEPRQMMELKEEVYVRNLQTFFRRIPRHAIFFDLTISLVGPKLNHTEYWGDMLWHSEDSDGLFPVNVLCVPYEPPTNKEKASE